MDAQDSENILQALLGESNKGRQTLVQQGGALSLVKDGWKYIAPNDGLAYLALTSIESGNAATPQLYDLKSDIGEKNNLADKYPDKVKELAGLLQKIRVAN